MSNVEEAREDLKEERKNFYIIKFDLSFIYNFIKKLFKRNYGDKE